MSEATIPIKELMEKTEQWLLGQGYKKSTLGFYRATWNRFLSYSASPAYSRETAEQFLLQYFGVDVHAIDQTLDGRMRHARRHMNALDEIFRTGTVCRRKVYGVASIDDDCFDKFFSDYLSYCKIPVLPYTRRHTKKYAFKPWDYQYNEALDCMVCPAGELLRHTTTDRNGKRTYRSTPSVCMNCPCREKCGANGKGQKLIQRHIWQEYLDVVEGIRKTDLGKSIYEKRKETIERVFADAKEKHSMRYTHMRGLARVTQWVRLKFAAMNLKKLANWAWKRLCLQAFGKYFWIFEAADGCCAA